MTNKTPSEGLRAAINEIIEDGVVRIANLHTSDSYRLSDEAINEIMQLFLNALQELQAAMPKERLSGLVPYDGAFNEAVAQQQTAYNEFVKGLL